MRCLAAVLLLYDGMVRGCAARSLVTQNNTPRGGHSFQYFLAFSRCLRNKNPAIALTEMSPVSKDPEKIFLPKLNSRACGMASDAMLYI